MKVDDSQHSAPIALTPRQRRLRVVGYAALFVVVVCGLYAAAPWVLPPWIVEGPMVQQASSTGAHLVWFTSREADCKVRLPKSPEATVEVRHDGARNEAIIGNLRAGESYEYEITRGGGKIGEGVLRASKSPGQPFHFVVFGDSGKGTREQYALGEQMAALDPDFVTHTGDLVYSRGERYHYSGRFFKPYAEMLARVAFWPSLGNHDVAEPDFGAPYLEVFSLPKNGPDGLPPERSYWFDYADARFVVIDTNLEEDDLGEKVAPWVRSVLSDPSVRWRFAVFHHPPYVVGGAHGSAERVAKTLVPVFEETGVDVVFNGHDHMYARTVPMHGGKPGDGPVYVISGAGGAQLYDVDPQEKWPPYFTVVKNAIHSFTHVRIDGDTLELRQIALGGGVLNEWRMTKPHE